MNPKQAGLPALRNKVSAAHIGGEHCLLNQTVRIVAGAGHDSFDPSAFVANNLRLNGLEVNCTPFKPGFEQGQVEIMQVDQVRYPGLVPEGLRPTGVGQERSHLGVGQAGMAPHHRRVKLVSANITLLRDKHVAHHAQTLHLRVEGAQAIGEFLGKHRNHPTREVDTGRTVVGIHINGRPVLNVMTDVGNRHQQTPTGFGGSTLANFCRLAVDRIIEIPGILAIDGDKGNIG